MCKVIKPDFYEFKYVGDVLPKFKKSQSVVLKHIKDNSVNFVSKRFVLHKVKLYKVRKDGTRRCKIITDVYYKDYLSFLNGKQADIIKVDFNNRSNNE